MNYDELCIHYACHILPYTMCTSLKAPTPLAGAPFFMGTGLGRFGFPATSSSSGATGWGSPRCRDSEERPPRPVSTRPRHSHRTWTPCGDLHGHPATTWTQRLRHQKKLPEVVLKGVICFRLASRGSRYYVYIFVYRCVYHSIHMFGTHIIIAYSKVKNYQTRNSIISALPRMAA